MVLPGLDYPWLPEYQMVPVDQSLLLGLQVPVAQVDLNKQHVKLMLDFTDSELNCPTFEWTMTPVISRKLNHFQYL